MVDPAEMAASRAQPDALADESVAFYVVASPGRIAVKPYGTWLQELTGIPSLPNALELNTFASRIDGPRPYSFMRKLDDQLFLERWSQYVEPNSHLLISSSTQWNQWISGYTQSPVAPPAVDYNKQQILVLRLISNSGCIGDGASKILATANVVQVFIKHFDQPTDRVCVTVTGESYSYFVIPKSNLVQVIRQAS